jgi:hypothetical protein
MKRVLIVLAVLGAMAAPAWSQDANDVAVRTFDVSGTAIPLGDPSAGPFPLLVTMQGKGPLGKFSAQALYTYQIDAKTGQLACGGGQIGVRFESTGDILLLSVQPGIAGTAVPVSPGVLKSHQMWTGMVVGGTGRFEGATGSFSSAADGLVVQPGFVHVIDGTLEIRLDRK